MFICDTFVISITYLRGQWCDLPSLPYLVRQNVQKNGYAKLTAKMPFTCNGIGVIYHYQCVWFLEIAWFQWFRSACITIYVVCHSRNTVHVTLPKNSPGPKPLPQISTRKPADLQHLSHSPKKDIAYLHTIHPAGCCEFCVGNITMQVVADRVLCVLLSSETTTIFITLVCWGC